MIPRKLLPVLLLLGTTACEPEIGRCSDPNQPTTYAALFTAPCPSTGTVIGWAKIEGVYRETDGDPIPDQPVHIDCPVILPDDPNAPFADAFLRSGRDGTFRTQLALRIDAEHDVTAPPSALSQECRIRSGLYAEVHDTIHFTPEFSDAETIPIELVWGADGVAP